MSWDEGPRESPRHCQPPFSPQMIQAFEVRPDPRGVEVTSVSRIVLVADKPINLEFIARPGAP